VNEDDISVSVLSSLFAVNLLSDTDKHPACEETITLWFGEAFTKQRLWQTKKGKSEGK
jgi:hypothetical protein